MWSSFIMKGMLIRQISTLNQLRTNWQLEGQNYGAQRHWQSIRRRTTWCCIILADWDITSSLDPQASWLSSWTTSNFIRVTEDFNTSIQTTTTQSFEFSSVGSGFTDLFSKFNSLVTNAMRTLKLRSVEETLASEDGFTCSVVST